MKISKLLFSTVVDLAREASRDYRARYAVANATGLRPVEVKRRAEAFLQAFEASGGSEVVGAVASAPTIWTVAYAVRGASATSAGYLPPAVYKGEDRWVDCRLQVDASGWNLHTGPSDFDTDHRGYWGATCYRAESRPLLSVCLDSAEELLDQTLDSMAQDASEDATVNDAFDAMGPWFEIVTRQRGLRR